MFFESNRRFDIGLFEVRGTRTFEYIKIIRNFKAKKNVVFASYTRQTPERTPKDYSRPIWEIIRDSMTVVAGFILGGWSIGFFYATAIT